MVIGTFPGTLVVFGWSWGGYREFSRFAGGVCLVMGTSRSGYREFSLVPGDVRLVMGNLWGRYRNFSPIPDGENVTYSLIELRVGKIFTKSQPPCGPPCAVPSQHSRRNTLKTPPF